MSSLSWGVVVPVKPLAQAKSRLQAFGDEARGALALAFACDVVSAALACPAVADVLVVTDDADVGHALAALGATVTADRPACGLNAALVWGASRLPSAPPRGVAALSADLPALTPSALAGVLGQVHAGERAFLADRDGTGTTLLAAAPGRALDPAYGPGSAERHRSSGARALPGAHPGVRLDVDTPEDLCRAAGLGTGPATARLLASLLPAGTAPPVCEDAR